MPRRTPKSLRSRLAILITLSVPLLSPTIAMAESNQELLQKLKTIQSGDADTRVASQTVQSLNSSDDLKLLTVLRAMQGATPLGRNYLSGLANSLYNKTGQTQRDELEAFVNDFDQDGEARYMVFHWLNRNPSERRARLLTMHDDPSPEIRHMAIDVALETTPDKSGLLKLLESARYPEQVVRIIAKLKELGTEVDQSTHFGFIKDWRLIGPFDNVGTVNFDVAMPVETDWLQGQTKDAYAGKKQKEDGSYETVHWLEKVSDSPEGKIDLASIYQNEKGCIVYATTEFESATDQDAELRLGCINGNKIWLNGKLVMSNEVYHTSMQIDQYVEPVHLVRGTNRILLKICQNEQKEAWAQLYEFQLRVCDSTGKAIHEKGL